MKLIFSEVCFSGKRLYGFALLLLCILFTMKTFGQVELIAHRGESGLAPENTLAAFRLAWESNADGVELDIHLSGDNRVMVIHDAGTKRTSGQHYMVRETGSEILRKLDVGSYKDSLYKGEKIPFLEEVLPVIPSGKKLVVEIKSGTDVLPVLETLVKRADNARQLVFIAFGWEVIVKLKQMFPENKCYWLSSNRNEILDKIDAAVAANLDGLDLHYAAIDKELMEKAAHANLEVIAWTVDDPVEAKRLIDLGVKGITTNRTAWLRAQLKQ